MREAVSIPRRRSRAVPRSVLDRFPLGPPDTRFVMITDQETQADLTAAYGAGKPAALTQEVDLERVFGAIIELQPGPLWPGSQRRPGAPDSA